MHQLPVAMNLLGLNFSLKMYSNDYGNSSDDRRPDEVPNSGSDNDAPCKAGPVSDEDCCPKEIKDFITLFTGQWK
jgi:hypothetical protein